MKYSAITDKETNFTQTASLHLTTPSEFRDRHKEVRFSPHVQYLGEQNDDDDHESYVESVVENDSNVERGS